MNPNEHTKKRADELADVLQDRLHIPQHSRKELERLLTDHLDIFAAYYEGKVQGLEAVRDHFKNLYYEKITD